MYRSQRFGVSCAELAAGFGRFRRLKISKAKFDFALTWCSAIEQQVGLADPLTVILGRA